MPAGRPKAIDSPDQMRDWFKAYVKKTKASPFLVHDFVGKDGISVERRKERPLTMEGFEEYVAENGGPLALEQYFSNREGRYELFVAICSRIRRAIRKDHIEGGMAGIYNPSITQRLNGLVDKSETTIREQPLFGNDGEDQAS